MYYENASSEPGPASHRAPAFHKAVLSSEVSGRTHFPYFTWTALLVVSAQKSPRVLYNYICARKLPGRRHCHALVTHTFIFDDSFTFWCQNLHFASVSGVRYARSPHHACIRIIRILSQLGHLTRRNPLAPAYSQLSFGTSTGMIPAKSCMRTLKNFHFTQLRNATHTHT